ncbi:GNAT family N-acetyltransferase [Hoeflea sp.]|uniref:GNAT family N-acetyltransferase n=1 Tax=Hoeflea sp. TaxID=1940281 RepID=UPI003BAED8D8
METQPTIRIADETDVDVIFAALRELTVHLGEMDHFRLTPQIVQQFGFGDIPAFQVRIAEIGDQFAGLCLYFPTFSTLTGSPGFYVQDLYIAPDHRKRGIGEKLLADLVTEATEQGRDHLKLSVHRNNESASRFYDRLGFERIEDEQTRILSGKPFAALLTPA